MSEICLQGLPAAPGILVGTLHAITSAMENRSRSAGDPAAELAALQSAIDRSIGDLEELASRVAGDGADILAFQIAMLGDEELAGPARREIGLGRAADQAWMAAMAVQIADYQGAGDEYFRARAADFIDLRDRVLGHLAGKTETSTLPPGAILAADELPPSRFLALDWSQGGAVALARGSPTSHVAMLARARGVPMAVGLGAELLRVAGGAAQPREKTAAIDGGRGVVVIGPGPERRAEMSALKAREDEARAVAATYRDTMAQTQDGTRIRVLINVADPAELAGIDPALCDGIGLVRTELLFHGHRALPDEEAQFAVYRRIVEWATGRPVTFRTLDAGGDKPIPGLTIANESNPFLGLRGLRLSLVRPEIFAVQLRALCRVAALGHVKVMLPMVSQPGELAQARAHLDRAIADLADAELRHARPALGIMVEVPAVALTPGRFAADFFSIGSNDLTQYVLAAARDLDSVAAIADPSDPAVLRLIAEMAEHGRAIGREVSLCGDAAADPVLIPALLGAGLRALSVAPQSVGRVKAAIASVRLDGAGR